MKKVPIKVLIRMRPTSNFAHHNMHVDEETGYIFTNQVIFKFMLTSNSIRASLTTNKANGDSNSKKFYLMHLNN